ILGQTCLYRILEDIVRFLVELCTVANNAVKGFTLPQFSYPSPPSIDLTSGMPLDTMQDARQGKPLIRCRLQGSCKNMHMIRHDCDEMNTPPYFVPEENGLFHHCTFVG